MRLLQITVETCGDKEVVQHRTVSCIGSMVMIYRGMRVVEQLPLQFRSPFGCWRKGQILGARIGMHLLCINVLVVRPWTQFFDLKGRKDTPMSYSQNIIMRNINVNSKVVFNLEKADGQYKLKDFLFEKFNVTTKNGDLDKSIIENLTLKKVVINGDKLK